MTNEASREIPPELVWEAYKTMVEECRHFNQLQSTYRTLASTWLLASFAATGFILKEQTIPDKELLMGGVSTAAAIGLLLLWLLDLKVYQRLLGAAFQVQRSLETKHPWLPQLAHGMLRATRNVGVTPSVKWFYLVGLLLLIAVSLWAFSQAPSTILKTVGIVGALAIGLGGGVGMFQSGIDPGAERSGQNEKASDKSMSTPNLVTAFYQRIWNDGDLGAARQLLTSEFTFRGSLGVDLRGHKAFEEYVRSIRSALADYRCDVLECVSEGDRAFAQMLFSGRHVGVLLEYEPTGKPVHWHGAALFRFEGQAISRLWVLGDLIGLEAILKANQEA